MWIFLLVLTFLIELLSFLICFGCGIASVEFLAMLSSYSSQIADHQPAQPDPLHMAIVVGLGHVEIVLCVYAFLIPLRLLLPLFEQVRSGARKPTAQELIQMDLACASLESAAYHHGMPFERPPRWLVLDSPFINIRYVGWTLVIDRGLIQSRFFEPLLAHGLAYACGSDRWAKTLLQCFAPRGCAFGFLLGFGLGLGPLLMSLPWKLYWRNREYAADEYTARLGQRMQLIDALETLFLPLDRATEFSIVARDVPYVALRIDRLRRLII